MFLKLPVKVRSGDEERELIDDSADESEHSESSPHELFPLLVAVVVLVIEVRDEK